jgi:hypothetical protein
MEIYFLNENDDIKKKTIKENDINTTDLTSTIIINDKFNYFDLLKKNIEYTKLGTTAIFMYPNLKIQTQTTSDENDILLSNLNLTCKAITDLIKYRKISKVIVESRPVLVEFKDRVETNNNTVELITDVKFKDLLKDLHLEPDKFDNLTKDQFSNFIDKLNAFTQYVNTIKQQLQLLLTDEEIDSLIGTLKSLITRLYAIMTKIDKIEAEIVNYEFDSTEEEKNIFLVTNVENAFNEECKIIIKHDSIIDKNRYNMVIYGFKFIHGNKTYAVLYYKNKKLELNKLSNLYIRLNFIIPKKYLNTENKEKYIGFICNKLNHKYYHKPKGTMNFSKTEKLTSVEVSTAITNNISQSNENRLIVDYFNTGIYNFDDDFETFINIYGFIKYTQEKCEIKTTLGYRDLTSGYNGPIDNDRLEENGKFTYEDTGRKKPTLIPTPTIPNMGIMRRGGTNLSKKHRRKEKKTNNTNLTLKNI